MSSAEHNLAAWSISIAGLGVALRCDDARLAAVLAERYRAFTSASPAQVVASLAFTSEHRTTSLLDTPLTFARGAAYFADGQGWVNIDQGQAQLNVGAAQPLEEVEYFLRIVYALLAFEMGGLLFHAAGIVRGGRSYLFFGHSGSGKTTIARCSPNDLILNDDLVLLLPTAAAWVAHATPFWNPTQVRPAHATFAPLAALLRLVQSKQVYLEAMSAGQALAEIIASAPVISADPIRSYALMLRCQALLRATSAYRLHFLPDASFWPLVEAL